MEPNKILSASILDLIFDDRNKEYGAYELRKTYSRRITKALLITAVIALLAFTGAALANSIKPDDGATLLIKELTLEDIKQDDKLPEPLPVPKKPEVQPVRTELLTPPVIVDDTDVQEPPPTQEDLVNAKISAIKQDGVDDIGLAETKTLDNGKDIIEPKTTTEPDIFRVVEIDAKFTGNWEKFLTRNLNANVPADNGAPAGKYTVVIQFVVDLEGNVSDIKPLTSHGYGMEEEAVRVLRKAAKWQPAIQNGRQVKAYRRQPITFVLEETN